MDVLDNPTRQGLEVRPVVCRRCGHMRIFSAHHLENA